MNVPIIALVILAAFAATAAPAAAQRSGPAVRQGTTPRDDEGGITPAEIRRMFDSYALMQAQEQLKITDEQFPRFLSRFKALQDVRRRNLMERNRRLQELRRLTGNPQTDETTLSERVKALQELEDRSLADLRKAYEGVDQVLDVRQQARFRVFEEQMEQRMLQLITRARAANRPRQ